MPVLFWIDTIVYILSSIISLSIFFVVFGSAPGKQVNQFFALFALSSACWTFFAGLLRLSLWLHIGDHILLGEISASSLLFMSPFLLLFTSRFLEVKSRIPKIAGVSGIFLCMLLGIPLFKHELINGYFFGPSGTMHVDLSTSGIVTLSVLSLLIVWSVILFWRERKKITEKYLPFSSIIFLLALILGAGIDIEFPVLSFATFACMGLLGFGIMSQQLFNPLREKNIELGREINEKMKTENALRKSETQVKALLAGIPDAIFYLDEEARIVDYKASREFGVLLICEVLLGKKPDEVFPSHLAIELSFYVKKAIDTGNVQLFEYALESGSRNCYFETRIMKIAEGHAIVLIRDVTQKKELEERVLQSQKMKAIDRLASGIAHDFNNLLTVIANFTDLSIMEFPNQTVMGHLDQIKNGVGQAAELTNQLLTFSRKQPLIPRIVSLNDILASLETMITRLLGDKIRFSVEKDPSLLLVKVDPGQMQQVIMNLCVNAKDALSHEGSLLIKTSNFVSSDGITTAHEHLPPGTYIRLTFKDTGAGMDKETQDHIFEPFFTTKQDRAGTGLGLATVHGIISQSGGMITVKSELERGTEFSIFLPAADTEENFIGKAVKNSECSSA